MNTESSTRRTVTVTVYGRKRSHHEQDVMNVNPQMLRDNFVEEYDREPEGYTVMEYDAGTIQLIADFQHTYPPESRILDEEIRANMNRIYDRRNYTVTNVEIDTNEH